MSWTIVIPARGGSKRVVGKNLLTLAGKPLLLHAIELAHQLPHDRVLVSTDNKEIAATVASHYPGTYVDWTFQHTDETTVDGLTEHYARAYPQLVVLQPTVIGVNPKVIAKVMNRGVGWFTLCQTLSGTYWVTDETNVWYSTAPRGEDPALFKEVGIRVCSGPFTRWHPVGISDQPLDLDTVDDFAAAEARLTTGTVVLNYLQRPGAGGGNLDRCLTLARAMQQYKVHVVNYHQGKHSLEAIREQGYSVGAPIKPPSGRGVWILDVQTSSTSYVAHLKGNGWKILAVEDTGPGAALADITLDPFADLRYAVLRPEFIDLPPYTIRPGGKRVLVTFGAEDWYGLRNRVAVLLAPHVELDTDPNQMAAAMRKADLVVCAGGRTVYEAAAVGVPTVVLSASMLEATHKHLGPHNGNIHLGLESEVSDAQIVGTVVGVLGSEKRRLDMSRRARAAVDGRGVKRFVGLVEELMG